MKVLTSATAPLVLTTAKGCQGVSTSDSAVAAFGVPGREARTSAALASAIAQYSQLAPKACHLTWQHTVLVTS